MKPWIAGSITFIMAASCMTGFAADAAIPAGKMLTWTGTNRTVLTARFVELADDKLTLELKDGKRIVTTLKSLDPASQRQVHQELERMGDQSISELRRMEFVKIPKGRFTMGSPVGEPGRATNGRPAEPVTANARGQINPADLEPRPDYEPNRSVDISGFWLKKTEVTWNEWNKVRAHAEAQEYFDLAEGRNGYQGSVDGSHPVTGITWWDAVKWCNLKSQVENRQPVYHTNKNFDGAAVFKMGNQEPIVNWEANGYRLPTEAEWEYACREGKNTDSYPYYGKLDSIAWYAANSGGNTHPVGKKTEVSHKFGLHDMQGNVSEWCWDYVGLLLPGKYDDPRGPSSGSFRVFRGGSWADPARSCRSAYRGSFSPAAPESCLVGFRPVCSGNPAEIPKP